MTIETIVIDEAWTYQFDDGRVDVLWHGMPFITHPLGGKALLMAATELEAHRRDYATLAAILPQRYLEAARAIRARRPERLNLEGGKYTVVLDLCDDQATHLLRYGREWISAYQLDLPLMWATLVHRLRSARVVTSWLAATATSHGLVLPILATEAYPDAADVAVGPPVPARQI